MNAGPTTTYECSTTRPSRASPIELHRCSSIGSSWCRRWGLSPIGGIGKLRASPGAWLHELSHRIPAHAVLVLPAIIAIVTFLVLPVGYLLLLSFNPPTTGEIHLNGQFTLLNYSRLLSDPFYLLIVLAKRSGSGSDEHYCRSRRLSAGAFALARAGGVQKLPRGAGPCSAPDQRRRANLRMDGDSWATKGF